MRPNRNNIRGTSRGPFTTIFEALFEATRAIIAAQMNTPTFEGKISVAIEAQMKSPTFEGKIPVCHEGTDEYVSIRETKIWLLLMQRLIFEH